VSLFFGSSKWDPISGRGPEIWRMGPGISRWDPQPSTGSPALWGCRSRQARWVAALGRRWVFWLGGYLIGGGLENGFYELAATVWMAFRAARRWRM
jgi:hypothetical protein